MVSLSLSCAGTPDNGVKSPALAAGAGEGERAARLTQSYGIHTSSNAKSIGNPAQEQIVIKISHVHRLAR